MNTTTESIALSRAIDYIRERNSRQVSALYGTGALVDVAGCFGPGSEEHLAYAAYLNAIDNGSKSTH